MAKLILIMQYCKAGCLIWCIDFIYTISYRLAKPSFRI